MRGPLQLTETVTISEAAKLLGISTSTVAKYIREGKLPAAVLYGDGRGWKWITLEDVEELRQELIRHPPKPGRKPRVSTTFCTL